MKLECNFSNSLIQEINGYTGYPIIGRFMSLYVLNEFKLCNGKGKGHPFNVPMEAQRVEQMYNSAHSQPQCQMGWVVNAVLRLFYPVE